MEGTIKSFACSFRFVQLQYYAQTQNTTMEQDCPSHTELPMRPPRRYPSNNNIPSDLPPEAEILPLDHTIGEDEIFTAPCRTRSSDDLNFVLEWTNDLADSMDHLALHKHGDDDDDDDDDDNDGNDDRDDDVSVVSFDSQNIMTEEQNTQQQQQQQQQQQRPLIRPVESSTSLYSIGRSRTIVPTRSEISQQSRGVKKTDSGAMSFCSMGSWADRFHAVVSPEGNGTVSNVVLMDCDDDHDDDDDHDIIDRKEGGRRLLAPCLHDLPLRTKNECDCDGRNGEDDEPIPFFASSHEMNSTTAGREGEGEISDTSGEPIMFGNSKHKASIYRSPSTEEQ